MRATRLDERVAEQTEGQVSAPLGQVVGEVVYWLIFLLFLPLIVNALGLSLGTGPLADMIGLFLAFIPKLVAAAGILAVGWFAAVDRAPAGHRRRRRPGPRPAERPRRAGADPRSRTACPGWWACWPTSSS